MGTECYGNVSDIRTRACLDWVLAPTSDQEAPVLPNIQMVEEKLQIYIVGEISQFKNIEYIII